MILIKDMEMPKGCASCFLKYGSCSSMRKRMDISKGDRWCPENYRHSDCPLIEVPEDVQPVKHGKWLDLWIEDDEMTDGGFMVNQCSVCKDEMYYGRPNYCPNCGALMGDEDDV